MTRLTDIIRKQIISDCIKEQFSAETEAFAKAEHDIATELYHHLFDSKTLSAVKKLPEKWLRMDSCLMFNCGGYRLTLNVNKAVPVPYSTHCSTLGAVSGELAEKAQKHAQDKEKARERQNHAYNALKYMLDNITTVKQLAQTWPEGEKFFKAYLSPTSRSLPAVQVSKVNELLNLKTDSKKGK